jgi:hypothetical protein
MSPADARRILYGIEQERMDMMKDDRSTWTTKDFEEHTQKQLRLLEAEERARKCLEEAADPARAGG